MRVTKADTEAAPRRGRGAIRPSAAKKLGRAATAAGVFPSLPHTLLLRAALLSGDDALRAWQEWVTGVDWEGAFDRASFRLLPLLHANLLRHGITHPVMPKLKGIYRRAWYETNQTLYRMRNEVEALKGAGLDVMLVKGAPLALAYYRSLGARPMRDIDVVVPTPDARAAIAVMEQRGWRRAVGGLDGVLTYGHALLFIDAEGHQCDLHWHVLCECCQPDADIDFWRDAEALDFFGIPVKMPSPADALLLAIVHGMRSNEEPVIRWVADAVTIVREAGARLDWHRLVRQAEHRRLSERLRLGLAHLVEEMDLAVPAHVLARLATVRISGIERSETFYALQSFPMRSRAALGDLPLLWASYRRFVGDVGPLRTLAGFPDYLRYTWRLGSHRDLAVAIARKARARAPLLFASRARALGAAKNHPTGWRWWREWREWRRPTQLVDLVTWRYLAGHPRGRWIVLGTLGLLAAAQSLAMLLVARVPALGRRRSHPDRRSRYIGGA